MGVPSLRTSAPVEVAEGRGIGMSYHDGVQQVRPPAQNGNGPHRPPRVVCAFRGEEVTKFKKIHGHANPGDRTYHTWASMKQRCYDKAHKSWPAYGGRGVTVCDEWNRSFEAFLRDMGEKPEGFSIGRLDNSLGYSKENCRWETSKQQARNRRSTRFVQAFGLSKPLAEWCEQYAIPQDSARYRLSAGWSAEQTFSQPLRPHVRSKV